LVARKLREVKHGKYAMNRLALAVLIALLGGCGVGPLNLGLLGRDAAREPAPGVDRPPIALQPSPALASPPPTPEPMQGEPGIGDGGFRTEQARALQGDKDAALRVAYMFREGTNGVPRDERRMVRWLRHASELNNASASYQLYLHYLARGLDRDAVRYENRALRQGYVPPPRLDHRRG
jgi:TPR repeat protein